MFRFLQSFCFVLSQIQLKRRFIDFFNLSNLPLSSYNGFQLWFQNFLFGFFLGFRRLFIDISSFLITVFLISCLPSLSSLSTSEEGALQSLSIESSFPYFHSVVCLFVSFPWISHPFAYSLWCFCWNLFFRFHSGVILNARLHPSPGVPGDLGVWLLLC